MPYAPRAHRPAAAPGNKRSGKSAAVHERCKLYRTKAWEQLRREVMVRDAMACQLCGALVIGKGNAHVDHIEPAKSEAEVLCDVSNLRLLCATCHSKRTAQENGWPR
jgi:5-methylcytosine-specific restriction endonuclease McrA